MIPIYLAEFLMKMNMQESDFTCEPTVRRYEGRSQKVSGLQGLQRVMPYNLAGPCKWLIGPVIAILLTSDHGLGRGVVLYEDALSLAAWHRQGNSFRPAPNPPFSGRL
jgi:hypothetical protein